MEPLPSWLLESWVEYAVAIVVILVRVFARTRPEGFNGWHGDDYLIVVTTGCFTALLYALQNMFDIGSGVVSHSTASASADDITIIQQESKEGFVAWATYVTAVWSLKGCMLYYFSRLDLGKVQKRFVKLCGWFVFLTYIGVWVCGLLKCLPSQHGSSNSQSGVIPGFCPPGVENFYVVGVTNLITDALIFSIPIPLLWRSQLSMRGLLLVASMFAAGLFIMAATCLRNVLSLMTLYSTGGNQGYILVWAVREIFAATLVVNGPCLKPLFSSTSWLQQSPTPSPTPSDPEKGIRNSTGNLSLSCQGHPVAQKHQRTSTSSSESSLAASMQQAVQSVSTSPPQLEVNVGNGNGTIGSVGRSASRNHSLSRSHSLNRSRSNSRNILPFNLKVNLVYPSECQHKRSGSKDSSADGEEGSCFNSSSSSEVFTDMPRTSVESVSRIGVATTTNGKRSCPDAREKEAPLTLVITKRTDLDVFEDSPHGGNNLNHVNIDAASKKRTSEGMRRSWGWRW